MKREPSLEILGLCISHLGLFAVAVSLIQSCQHSRDRAETHDDPMYQLGLHFDREPEPEAEPAPDLPPIEPVLRAIRASDGPQAANLLQLALQLRRNQLDAAATTCAELGLRRCDVATLVSMRAEVMK